METKLCLCGCILRARCFVGTGYAETIHCHTVMLLHAYSSPGEGPAFTHLLPMLSPQDELVLVDELRCAHAWGLTPDSTLAAAILRRRALAAAERHQRAGPRATGAARGPGAASRAAVPGRWGGREGRGGAPRRLPDFAAPGTPRRGRGKRRAQPPGPDS